MINSLTYNNCTLVDLIVDISKIVTHNSPHIVPHKLLNIVETNYCIGQVIASNRQTNYLSLTLTVLYPVYTHRHLNRTN